ncbi:MAG: tRNA (adenosine(37)-N6)-threonylcarbamoyltransferase complex ATPase subunit type 1 TsaE [Candidatus Paceibacterota bacterium]|jgi:tRNA threonylcarbamoyladenosine biosynthesis protein TsaE
MRIVSKSLAETEKIAKDFLDKISLSYGDSAMIVGLYGDLGSGKTTFTQALARILGVNEIVTSPTFVIEKRYTTGSGKFSSLIHIDAYRLDSSREMLALNWKDISRNPQNLIFIEWPERILDILPENHLKIFFKSISESEREIEI